MSTYERKIRRRSRRQKERAIQYREQKAERQRQQKLDREFLLSHAGPDGPVEMD